MLGAPLSDPAWLPTDPLWSLATIAPLPLFFFFSAWELTVFPCILPFFFQPFACTRELDGFVRASPWLKGERQKWQLCSLAIDGEQRKIGAGLCLSLGM